VDLLGYPDRESLLGAHAADTYAEPGDRERLLAQVEQEGVYAGRKQ